MEYLSLAGAVFQFVEFLIQRFCPSKVTRNKDFVMKDRMIKTIQKKRRQIDISQLAERERRRQARLMRNW